MSDFPDAPTGAPNGAGASYVQSTKENAAAAYEQLSSGPMAQNVRAESQKTSTEFSSLAASRKTPTNPAATGQPLTHYHSFFSELLSWKNPRASAIAYASVITAIFAARYLDVLRWSLRLTWMALGTTVLAEALGKLVLNHGLTTQVRPRRYYVIPKETLDVAIGDVHELINFFVIESQRILFAENLAASGAALVAAFVSYFLVKVMPLWGLAVAGTTALFFVPLVYTTNQELIDHHLKQATDVVNEQANQFRSIAGKHTAQATEMTKQYMGDYTAKAQQMLGRDTSGNPTKPTSLQNESGPEMTQTKPAADSEVVPEVAPLVPEVNEPATEPVAPAVKEADFPAAPDTDLTREDDGTIPEPVVPEKEPMLAS